MADNEPAEVVRVPWDDRAAEVIAQSAYEGALRLIKAFRGGEDMSDPGTRALMNAAVTETSTHARLYSAHKADERFQDSVRRRVPAGTPRELKK